MEKCKSCDAELRGNYCSNCGQKATFERIDFHYVLHEVEHIIHFERGFLYTIKKLLIQPGQGIRKFIQGNRNKMTKPLIFIILSGLIYKIFNYLFQIDFISESIDNSNEFYPILEWFSLHYDYLHIFVSFIAVFWIKLFFRKISYNFFELMTLLCYIMGITILLDIPFNLIEKYVGNSYLGVFVGQLYLTWSMGQFFGNKPINYLKAFFVNLLSITVFFILIFIFDFLLPVILK